MRRARGPVDEEHALMVGATAMVLSMAEERLAAVLAGQVIVELVRDVGDPASARGAFLAVARVEVDGVERYRLYVDAVRDEEPIPATGERRQVLASLPHLTYDELDYLAGRIEHAAAPGLVGGPLGFDVHRLPAIGASLLTAIREAMASIPEDAR